MSSDFIIIWNMMKNHEKKNKNKIRQIVQNKNQQLLKQKWLLHKRAEYWKDRRLFPSYVISHEIGNKYLKQQ